jgi:signal peptidase I
LISGTTIPPAPNKAAPPGKVSRRLALALTMGALLSGFLMHRYVYAIYIIEGSSMCPALNDGDTALVNMLARQLGTLDRGEIVLVRDGRFQEYATKRIVGLPGERIDFRENQVFVDGKPLPEPYLRKQTMTESEVPTFQLGKDEYFVLGDNRVESYDSRIYGPVPKKAIMGSYTKSFWACR